MSITDLKHRRSCLRTCRYNIRNYTVNLSAMLISLGMIWSGLSVLISSIEKRYALSSYQSGFIFSATEIGRIPMLPLVSYFGNRCRIPRLIAICGLGISLSHFIVLLPHFVFAPATLDTPSKESHQVCNINLSRAFNSVNSTTDQRTQENNMAYSMIIAGMVLMGVFVSPLTNLAISYIDNNSPEGKAPMYIGIVGCAWWSVGPLIGSLLGAYYMTIYVDLTAGTHLTPKDPAWVGAWWLMILTCAVAVFVSAPFIACYPRDISSPIEIELDILSPEVNCKDDQSNGNIEEYANLHDTPTIEYLCEKDGEDTAKQTIYTAKDFPAALLRIVKNPLVFFITGFSILWETAGVGYRAYLPKYLENQFRITAWNASIYAGMANVMVVVSYLLSGMLLSKLKLSYLGAIKMVVVSVLGAIAANAVLMSIGCDSTRLAGHISPNRDDLSLRPCGSGCQCDLNIYSPVCDRNTSLTYFSPCHAGCVQPHSSGNHGKIVSGCNCTSNGRLDWGPCETSSTEKLVIFLVTFYIESFFFRFAYTPVMAVLMRCVKKQDKGLAMGISFLFTALLAWMPCTIIYGRVIDLTCSLWQAVGNTHGACWLYDLDKLRQMMFGVNISLQSLALFFMIATALLSRKLNITWTSENE